MVPGFHRQCLGQTQLEKTQLCNKLWRKCERIKARLKSHPGEVYYRERNFREKYGLRHTYRGQKATSKIGSAFCPRENMLLVKWSLQLKQIYSSVLLH